MNRAMVTYVSGRILILVGILMSPSLLISWYYQEQWRYQAAIAFAVALTIGTGFLLSYKKPEKQRFYIREGLIITSLCWVLLSIAGALPYFITGEIPSFIDALFESSSGFSTTGSTILNDIEVLPHSLLFWRSFTHFIGGMGVLVFALAVLPEITGQSVYLMKAETTGPSFGKLVSRLKETARILYLLYAGFTIVLVVVLFFAGMTPFDALVHAMATAGTGGFSSYNESIAAFHSPIIEYIIAVAMLIYGVNFYLYYHVLKGHIKDFFQSEELRFYVFLVVSAFVLITWNIHSQYRHVSDCIRDVFFSVASIITTTGFGTADFQQWPLFSKVILLFLMFCGSCAGSTAGGFKVDRVLRLLKIVRAHLMQVANPRRMTPIIINRKPMSERAQFDICLYLMTYCLIFAVLVGILSFDQVNFTTAFTAVLATFNNIGPGLDGVGPTSNYSALSNLSKLSIIFGMLAGRLEIFPMLILFAPSSWRLK